MKKLVFSFLTMLALVVLAGTSAYAQLLGGSGHTPGTSSLVAVGSKVKFTTVATGTNTIAWTVSELPSTADIGNDALIVAAPNVQIITSLADTSVGVSTNNDLYVWFKKGPAAGNVYSIQALETAATGACITRRRFFVSVFDFEVIVALCQENGDVIATDQTICNSWSGDVVKNTISAATAAAMHRDSINNGTADEYKVTSTYFSVTFNLVGTPASLITDSLKWLMNYSLPAAADTFLYKIVAHTNPDATTLVGFSAENAVATPDSIVAAENARLSISNAATLASNNTIYFPRTQLTADAQTATWVFEVQTHNLLGEVAQVFDWQAMRVQLEFGAAASEYNDGTKVAHNATSSEAKLATASQSESYTINNSPATPIIVPSN